MRKLKLSFLFCLSIFCVHLCAAPVDITTAGKVAANFYRQMNPNSKSATPTLATTWQKPSSTKDLFNCFYIFNVDNGFVIVSGDDRAKPILAFSTEGNFDIQQIPESMQGLLQDYADEMLAVLASPHTDRQLTAGSWNRYLTQKGDTKDTVLVEPLIQTTWAQTGYYNELCPADPNGQNGHALVGCIAVVMGQIMKYWEYPETGQGSYGYNCNFANYGNGYDNYGYLSADFGNATYDYANMPNKLTWASDSVKVNAIATLLYHCGIGAHMTYGSIGSMANTNNMVSALTNYFRYESDIRYIERQDYTADVWLQTMKTELDSLQPFCYGGTGNQGGHAFTCDGYSEDGYFHVNWGWNGTHNGYFLLSDMSPGPYSFNSAQAAIIGIRGPHLPGVGVQEHPNETSLSVYPNPSNGQFTIQLSSDNLLPQSNFSIYDIYGRLLKSGRVESERSSINFNDLSAGTYILQVGTSTGKISQKIIIQ